MRRAVIAIAVVAVVVAAFVLPRPAEGASEPLQAQQWNLDAVEAERAWARADGTGVVVAVVDTGVDKDHPELSGRLVDGASWHDCGQGVKAPCTGPEAWDDRNGHGTHVAGIAAAPLDGRGVAGVAPGASIMPVRVLDAEGSGSAGDVARGVRWAVDHGADVVNLSLAGLPVVSNLAGALGADGGFAEALRYAGSKGVVVVTAAGNEAFPICDNEFFDGGPGICVGATDRHDQKAWYSNSGPGLDVVAPGGQGGLFCEEDVLSTYALDAGSGCAERGYEALAGTSMAAPHVAGVAALALSAGFTGQDAAERVLATVDDLGTPGWDPVYGAGRVNAARAVGS